MRFMASLFTAWMWAAYSRPLFKLRGRGLKIGLAESCTAGLIAKRITEIPGSSEVLECGIVSYSNRIKEEVLGVSRLLLKHTA